MKKLNYIALIIALLSNTINESKSIQLNPKACKSNLFTNDHTINITNNAPYSVTIEYYTTHNFKNEKGECIQESKKIGSLDLPATTNKKQPSKTSFKYSGTLWKMLVVNKNDSLKKTVYKTYSNTNKAPQKIIINDSKKTPGKPSIDVSDFIKK
ncbi:MAG: hypothetical protein ACXWL2_05120 [Candidatus Chromulinivorax sp.]